MVKLNYPPILNKMKNTIKLWEKRPMSLSGKITIVKTLITPKLVYAMTVLPSPPPDYFMETNDILYKFINDNKRDKIKRNTLIGSYKDGGYNMVDIECQNRAIKIGWLRRLLDCPGKWSNFVLETVAPVDHRYMLECNVAFKDLPFKFPMNNVWGEIWAYWCIYNYRPDIENIDEIIKQNLWFNSNIKAGNQVLFNSELYGRSINYLHQLCYEDSHKLMSYADFVLKTGCQINFLNYYTIIASLPKKWKNILREANDNIDDNDVDIDRIDWLAEVEKPVKYIYAKLIKQKHEPPILQSGKWQLDCNEIWDTDAWLHCFGNKITLYNRLNSFKYKLLLRAVPYRKRLYYMKIAENPLCLYCKKEGTLIHTYWECEKIYALWISLQTWVENIYGKRVEFCKKMCILGVSDDNTDKIAKTTAMKLMCLITCHFIHNQLCLEQEPEWARLKNYIKNISNIEHQIYASKGKMNLFHRRWGQIANHC